MGRTIASWLQAPPEDLDRFDYPYMELVTEVPVESERGWCQLDSKEASHVTGKYHVGGQVRSLRGGTLTTDDTSRTDGKPQPTSYEPDPVLKGGVG